jgi:hypothetical protein
MAGVAGERGREEVREPAPAVFWIIRLEREDITRSRERDERKEGAVEGVCVRALVCYRRDWC